MNTGFEVFNERGFKIIGSDYANLVYYGKLMLTVQAGAMISGIPWDAYATLPPNDSTLRFYRASFPCVEQAGLVRAPKGFIGAQIECYMFGPVKPAATSYGLELYTPDGALTFNTARPFLRLLGVHVDPRNAMLDFQVGNGSYPPQDTGLRGQKLAWTVGNARYFYRRTQFTGNSKYPNGFTDEFEAILAVSVADSGEYRNMAIQYGPTRRTSGWVGYGSHVPPTGPIRILVADVAGL